MRIFNINTQEGPISVGVKFFQDLTEYEVIDLGETIFIKDLRTNPITKRFMFSMSTTEWNEVQSEIRDNKIDDLLNGH